MEKSTTNTIRFLAGLLGIAGLYHLLTGISAVQSVRYSPILAAYAIGGALLPLAASYGLWKQKEWGRILSIVLFAITALWSAYAVFTSVAMAVGSASGVGLLSYYFLAPFAILIVSLAVILLLCRAAVKEAFNSPNNP